MSNTNDVIISTEGDVKGWLALAAEVEDLFGPMVAEPGFLETLTRKMNEKEA